MSKWQDIPKEDIELDGDEINICLEGDEFGNNYAVVKVADMIDLLTLKFGEKISGWISVEDKLPEGELVDVIACLKNKTVHKVVFSTIGSLKWFVVGVGMIHPYNPVTHWMPLPEPPKD